MWEKTIKIFSDSRLVVGQVGGELEARDERMRGYLSQVRHLQSKFESFSLLHIPRSGNTHADSLTMLTTSSTQSLPQVILIKDLCKPTEVMGKVVHVHQVNVGPNWMDPIVLFLREDILPADKLMLVYCSFKVLCSLKRSLTERLLCRTLSHQMALLKKSMIVVSRNQAII